MPGETQASKLSHFLHALAIFKELAVMTGTLRGREGGGGRA
jgi:hypothetical protein